MQTRLKAFTLLLTTVMVVTLVTAKLATGTAVTQMYPGKQLLLDTQVIKATDVLTGAFRASEAVRESAFDFGRFRILFIGILAFLAVNYALLLGNKRFAAAISVTLACGAAAVCAVYFDSFHGYYWESVEARFVGISPKTIHVAFGWLSKPLFWLLFVALLLLNWIPVWLHFRKSRSVKRAAADLIDG